MLSVSKFEEVAKAATEMACLADELYACRLRLIESVATKEYAISIKDKALEEASAKLEKKLRDVIAVDERLMRVDAQLVECILS